MCHPTLSLASPPLCHSLPLCPQIHPLWRRHVEEEDLCGLQRGTEQRGAGMSKHERESETRDQNFGNERH